MKKNNKLSCILLGIGLFLSSCSSSMVEPETEKQEPANQDWVTISTTNEEWAQKIKTTWSAEDIIDEYVPGHKAIFDFSERLTDEIGKRTGSDGFVISPFSVVTQLAIIANSTDDSGREELLKFLNIEDIEKLNRYCTFFLIKYTDIFKDKASFNNNHLWLANGCYPNMEYVEKIGELFNVGVERIDFSNSNSVEKINDWMNRYSNNSIDNYVNSDLLKGKNHLFANALSVDASIPVLNDSPSAPHTGVFHAPEGDIEVQMIKGLRHLAAFGAENNIAEKMEICIDGPLSVSIYVPKEYVKPEDLTRVINADVRRELDESQKQVTWRVNLPVVDFTSKTDVLPYLTDLGMDILNNVDLSVAGITTPGTSVFNQTRVKLGEGRLAGDRDVTYDSKIFNIDKPFIFSVGFRATALDLCIVSGVIANPGK